MLALEVLPERLAVSRLAPAEGVPAWASRGGFFSISRTSDELSVVCLAADVPEGVKSERGWRCFKVKGPLDFALTGVLHSLLDPLARAKISVFALSTYDTDYILVREGDFERASGVLAEAGFLPVYQ